MEGFFFFFDWNDYLNIFDGNVYLKLLLEISGDAFLTLFMSKKANIKTRKFGF